MFVNKLILAISVFVLTGTAFAQIEPVPTTLPTPVLLIEELAKPEEGQKKTDEEMERIHAPALPGEEEAWKADFRAHSLNNWWRFIPRPSGSQQPIIMPALYRHF